MYAFILLLVIIAGVYVIRQESDGFRNTIEIPKNIVDNCPKGSSIIPVQLNRSGDPSIVKPYSMSGEVPIAPYQQIAAMSPLPYQDTTLVKANMQQLSSLLEMMKGFFAFEAQELVDRSDPSIQLPLQTARSDVQVLEREVDVQNRNPGIQSTVTLKHLNEISSNLAYLQDKVRLFGSAGSTEGFTNGGTAVSGTATTKDLADFIGRIQGEIKRLSASGTNDPIMVARIKSLTNMQGSIQDILSNVENDLIRPTEIPIMKSDIDKALPILGNPSEPLPQVLRSLQLPEGWANAIPSSLQKDPQTIEQVRTLIDKYGQQFINGVSATFQVKYTPPNQQSNCTVDQSGFPSASDLDNVSNAQFIPMDQGGITDQLAQRPHEGGRGPARFDWKLRAKEIENQVKQRGLNPSDFGITGITNPSKDFSWKGYARMICTRLQSTMDPGLPETCGCPPLDWKGWRNSH